MELKDFLSYLIAGGGAGLVAYWIVDRWLSDLQPEWKRYTAWAITAAIAIGVYMIEYVFGYVQSPGPDWRAWVEALFKVVAIAIGVNQTAHARLDLSKRGH